MPKGEGYECLINSEDVSFGGSIGDTHKVYPCEKGIVNGYENHITLELPKLSGMILKRVLKKEKSKKKED